MFLLLTLLIFFSFQQNQTNNQQENATISPIPTRTPSSISKDVQYNSEESKKIWGRVKNKATLSIQDAQAKETLLKDSLKASDIVYESENVQLYYISTFDFFQAEIITQDINAAKQEAVSWLESYGLSQQGICNLPLIFHLNSSVEQSLRGKNIIFSPIAEGC